MIATGDPDALTNVLKRLEEHVHAGGEGAGFLHYEAGYALEPQLRPLRSQRAATLIWFGLYGQAAVFDDICFPESARGDRIENVAPTITREQYCEKLDEIRALIAAGETYQINFTYPVRFRVGCSAWQLFVDLCRRHPVPCAAFVNTGD